MAVCRDHSDYLRLRSSARSGLRSLFCQAIAKLLCHPRRATEHARRDSDGLISCGNCVWYAVAHDRRSTIPRSCLHPLDYCNALLTGIAKCQMKRLQTVQNAAACLVSGAHRRDHVMPHYCATFVGCQWDSELSSRLLSSFGSVSIALLQYNCKSYAHKWTTSAVVPEYGLRQLAASSYHMSANVC